MPDPLSRGGAGRRLGHVSGLHRETPDLTRLRIRPPEGQRRCGEEIRPSLPRIITSLD